MSFKGKVTAIPQSNTSFGVMYNVEVAGKKYGFGKYPPKFSVGDYIEFEADLSGRFPKMDYKSVKVVPEPAGEPAPAARGNYASKSYGNDDKRQEVISRQAARNSAIAALALLNSLDALPKAPAKASAGEKFDLFSGLIDEMTENYFKYSINGPAAVNNPKADLTVGEDVDTSDEWDPN